MVYIPTIDLVTRNASPSIDDLVATTVSLLPRSKKSSDDCDDDDSSSQCQKPVSTDSLTVGLAVGIPVALIILVLGFFLFKNYRKDKKESLEHDPDFDENGEATALPDFPNLKYTMEDPFHNRNSVRFPNANKSSASLAPSTMTKEDLYIDNFVLPYQHQTGSKVSLDEYARHLGSGPAFGGTPRSSSFFGNRTRNSSFSNINNLDVAGRNGSPQKSNLKTEVLNANKDDDDDLNEKIETKSPLKSIKNSKSGTKYTNIPNDSTASFNPEHFYNANDTLNDSSTDVSDNSASRNIEKFAINYENESESALNQTKELERKGSIHPEPTIIDNSNLENFHSPIKASIHQRQLLKMLNKSAGMPAPNIDMGVESPFEDKFEINRKPPTPGSAMKNSNSSSPNMPDPDIGQDSEIEGEGENEAFNFSSNNDDEKADKHTIDSKSMTNGQDDNVTTTETTPGSNNVSAPNNSSNRKSIGLNQFNLLSNDSDDDDEEEKNIDNKPLSPEQDEELKRMKSIYKVYFDRSNTVKTKNGGDEAGTFEHDTSNPLPDLQDPNASYDHLKINKDLKGDTNYDKRMTTTSSIYTETPIFSHEEQQYYYNQQQLANDPAFYNQFPLAAPNQVYPYPQQQQPPKPKNLPPLRSLPTASDIRQSTIQTYTDFQPRAKNIVTSPTGKQPFVPIENDGVWTSPVTSPVAGSQSSFQTFGNQQPTSPNSGYVPPLPNAQAGPGAPKVIPSASQLARSSVVMLNPVTEITKQRKFKPAGSLPSGAPIVSPNMYQYQQPQFNESVSATDNDLIPGSRKSDVRRMMNTNF